MKKFTDMFMKSSKSTMQLVEEIHDEFYTEVDKLLRYAENTTNEGDVSLLNRIGFVSASNHKRAQENEEKNALKKAINYFSVKYPLYKFITIESVQKICDKYGLVYGDASIYTGNIPERNINEIGNFKIDEVDFCYSYSDEYKENHEFFLSQSEYLEQCLIDARDQLNLYYRVSYRCQLNTMEIVGPQSDFKMDDQVIERFRIKSDIPDPVVLMPVAFKKMKYYLIVTAWGTEASDEDVINEKLN